jgi:hypothetical protein
MGFECVDSQFNLNAYLKTLLFIPNILGEVSIYFEVNDLGNTDYLKRPLTANATLTISITAVESTLLNSNNALTISLAVAGAVALGLAALGVWKIAEHFKAPVDQYFENLTTPSDITQLNPLYQSPGVTSDNPLYVPPT